MARLPASDDPEASALGAAGDADPKSRAEEVLQRRAQEQTERELQRRQEEQRAADAARQASATAAAAAEKPCTNRACSFLAHEAPEFCGFCCQRCRWAANNGQSPEHGPRCLRRLPGAPAAQAPADPTLAWHRVGWDSGGGDWGAGHEQEGPEDPGEPSPLDALLERRWDMEAWAWLTWEQLQECHRETYGPAALRQYWELECVEEQRRDPDGTLCTWRQFRRRHVVDWDPLELRRRWRLCPWVGADGEGYSGPGSLAGGYAAVDSWVTGSEAPGGGEGQPAPGRPEEPEEPEGSQALVAIDVSANQQSREAGVRAMMEVQRALRPRGAQALLEDHAASRPRDPLADMAHWLAEWDDAAAEAGFVSAELPG